jgi:hypothetical protein
LIGRARPVTLFRPFARKRNKKPKQEDKKRKRK